MVFPVVLFMVAVTLAIKKKIYKGDYFYLHTICLHKVTQRLRKTNWLLVVGYVYLHGTCVHSSQQARNGPRRRAEAALREDI